MNSKSIYFLILEHISCINFSWFIKIRIRRGSRYLSASITLRACHIHTHIRLILISETNLDLFFLKVLLILRIISVQIHLHHNITIHFHQQIQHYHHRQVQQLMFLCLFVFNLWIVLYGNYAQVEFGFKKKKILFLSYMYQLFF